jgi:hypothetical protein
MVITKPITKVFMWFPLFFSFARPYGSYSAKHKTSCFYTLGRPILICGNEV